MPVRADGSAGEFDAILFLSFGGPEGPDDVMPFLENVTRGRGVPRERLEEVAHHYMHFGGVSPINQLNRDMIASLRAELDARGTDLPIYFGNRNWYPLVADTLVQMYDDGHRRILAFATSAWGGYSGCRQYHEDIERSLVALHEARPQSVSADPVLVRKLPQFWDRSATLTAGRDAVLRAASRLPAADVPPRLVCTAHSIPIVADAASGPEADGGQLYSRQVAQAAQRVAEMAGFAGHDQVWQSRSGPPQVPWLEPDICDHLEAIAAQGVSQVIVFPVGFVSDHVEVVWDLDNEAAQLADELGLDYVRAETVGTDPRFIAMVADLVDEYRRGTGDLDVLGVGDSGTPCGDGCCGRSVRRPATRP
ncbi:ferrochelatase [Gordonia desulfuricans]|uniref:Coproporphyrin III ferrochelatase n=1 Tax=Gordonia desulfuricans TaxID=89051 RepID=A0A7K3LQL6_9ACTN|nr:MULTISPECIES: ferrochelatase [Gordonia]EMP14631.1 ferrochelatase [Gordonia sp. NB41Y]NDK90539.1 ferrochelatase [Gordonia desulfuricans]WLP90922.1 ferrochelatase [Gordonia sp. NB41Y]